LRIKEYMDLAIQVFEIWAVENLIREAVFMAGLPKLGLPGAA
jgi:hypothetical protein